MTTYLLFLCGCFLMGAFPAFSQAQEPIYLWNGFSHHWGYNHRVNRLGDFLQHPLFGEDEQVAAVHTAASGSGSDRCQYTSYYTHWQTDAYRPLHGRVQFSLQGKEGVVMEDSIQVEIDLDAEALGALELSPADLSERDLTANGIPAKSLVLLDGFDLKTSLDFKADKFQEFSFSCSPPRYLPSEGPQHSARLAFTISVRLKMKCASPECEWFKNEVGYDLDVYWQVLLPTRTAVEAGSLSPLDSIQATRALSWNRDTLARPEVELLADTGTRVMGLTGFSLETDPKDLHFRDLVMALVPPYGPEPALGTYRAHLYFGQWHPDMYTAYKSYYTGKVKLPAKWVVKRKPGVANLRLSGISIPVFESEVQQSAVEGEIRWQTSQGSQTAGNDESAWRRIPIGGKQRK